MKKEIRTITMLIPAQEAVLNSPISPMLGQFGVKAKKFCDDFNSKTKVNYKGMLLKTSITIYEDLSYSFIVNYPTSSFFIFMMAESDIIHINNIYIISLFNMKIHKLVINEKQLKSYCKNLLGICKSMKINVIYN